jgi:hypothetical protein
MLNYLFQTTSGPMGFKSFVNFWHIQIVHLRTDVTYMDWFKPRELWPKSLSPDYLATMTKPAGIILLLSISAIFILPNTSQLFGEFKPALGKENHDSNRGIIRRLDGKVAFILSFLFVLSVLRLAHVSPFLYFQF